MPLAPLYTVPRNSQDWSNWSFNNADSHLRVINAVFSKFQLQLPYFSVDPIPWNSLSDWLRNHQQMHNDIDGLLNVDSSDFTLPNFHDEEQMEAFIFSHADEHRSWEDFLGID
jgi:hypothetical protein